MTIIRGRVEKGRGLGKELGFPTLNLAYDGDLRGVFAGRVLIDGRQYKGAVHLGPRPTLADEKLICEVFLLDFEGGEIEGEVSVEVLEKLRDIIKFEDLEALKAQIAKDVEEIKNLLRWVYA